jgi:hypothetical protein
MESFGPDSPGSVYGPIADFGELVKRLLASQEGLCSMELVIPMLNVRRESVSILTTKHVTSK